MAVSTIKKGTPSWSYVGDVYWWDNSWTCPADGFIEAKVAPNSSSWYWYISDTEFADTGWSHCMTGNSSNQQNMTFFVKKGSVLSTATMSGISTARAYYYKFN